MGLLNSLLFETSRYIRLSNVYHKPTHIQIELTNRCNVNCIECYRTMVSKFNRKIGDLSYDDFVKIFQRLPTSINKFTLIGAGESLLNRDFFAIADYISRNRAQSRIFITTNATLVDLEIAKKLKERHIHVQISFAAATEETYKKVYKCSGSLFFKAIKGIEALFAVGYEPSITIMLLKDNIRELVEYVEFAYKIGVKKICFGEQNYSGIANANELRIQDVENYKKNLEMAITKTKELGVDFSHSKRNKDVWGKKAAFLPCYALWRNPYITWDGYVTPCCSRPIPEEFNFGNLFENDFKKIWFSNEYKKLRNQVIKGRSNSICRDCGHLSLESFIKG